ncbi:iron complex outermembrane recepter protein [Sphingobium sp. AP50]|uniref:TonB-dependent receptor n=1 Tax=Sphingobium sp. AP50 TaxID=1884369 RepID=UPI0008B62ECC|nr:TonB-dependent receptor [Sphingobium sp. AP50]SEJ25798.1 iron complex outermembrane recepter protein [Sphingobium sp. AP50]
MRKINLTIAVLAGASAIALSAPAFAQDAAPQAAADTPDANSDIIVTAQRKAEKVTEVPISITVANAAQLERQQVNTMNDLNRIAPSLEIQQAPGQNTGGGGSIRGIGTQTFSAGAVASVGVVVDQVSQGNANISDLFDVSRVEVLKGPQGTLFGLTTSAGVINITTNAPDFNSFSARVRGEVSDAGTAGSKFGNQVLQGVVNVPLASNAAIRVSGVANMRQGVNRNLTTGNLNDTDRYGVRARLLWEPTDKLTVNVIGDYAKSRIENGGDFFTFVKTSASVAAELANCGIVPGEGNSNYCTDSSYVGHNENYGGSLQIDYEAEPFTLTSITALRKSNETGYGAASNVFRADPLAIQVANGPVNRRLSLFTQEFRISSPSDQFLEYTAGAFYSRQKQTRDPETLSVMLTLFPGMTIPLVDPATAGAGANDSIVDESLAFFGQGTFHLSPSLRLIAGGRYTTGRLSLDRYNYATSVASDTVLNVDNFSYKFGGQYDLARNTMVYATASRGFKGGQIATPSAPAVPFTVLPEIPTAYEAGLKTTLFGGWVADLSVFYQKIKNFQAQQCTVDNNSVISCVQRNIDGVKSRGAEINFFGKVFDGLSLNTGFIYAKATYPGGFIGTDGTDIGGSQLAYAPKYKFTLSGEYEAPVSSRLNAFVAADTVWKSRVRYEANSRDETTFRSHWLVGGRVGIRTEDDRYSLAIFGRNLFNVHEPSLMQSDFPADGAANIGAIYGPQSFRQVGLSFDAKF